MQGVIKLGDKASESKCTLVYGQMNEPPGARARVALTGRYQFCKTSCISDKSCLFLVWLATNAGGFERVLQRRPCMILCVHCYHWLGCLQV